MAKIAPNVRSRAGKGLIGEIELMRGGGCQQRPHILRVNDSHDFVLYVTIALAVVFAVLWFGFKTDGRNSGAVWKWIGLTGTSLILFGYMIKPHQLSFELLSFWVVVSVLLALHLLAFYRWCCHTSRLGKCYGS